MRKKLLHYSWSFIRELEISTLSKWYHRTTYSLTFQFMQYANGTFGFEPFTLVSNLRFFTIEFLTTTFEIVLSYWHKSKFVADTENDEPTVEVTSAFLKHASRVDVIKAHGYICAAICNESDVSLWGCSSIDVWCILSKEV